MNIEAKHKKLLEKHLDCVLNANKIHNLTNIKNRNEAQILHIEDSLAGILELNQAKQGKLVDLGSGAGYPGIPLAIVSGRNTTLVESVQKKADCLESFVHDLNLSSNIFVSNNRIEEEAVQSRNSYAAATARALSSISSLLELASPLLEIGGSLICYKASEIDEELEDAQPILDKLGMALISNRLYGLSNGINHRIILFNKVADSDINLPRKLGLAQKRPLR